MSIRKLLAGAAVIAALIQTAAAADAPAAEPVTIESGAGSVRLDMAALKAMPSESRQITFQTEHGPENALYHGVSLLAVLKNAGAAAGTPKARLKHVITVTGRDGYAVVLAWGEIDPDFEAEPVMLAYARNGQALKPAGSVRLIVPGDRHGGRDVRDVTTISVQ